MTELYTGLRGTAQSLMASYGQALTFTREVQGAYDPLAGSTTTTTSTYTLRCVVMRYRNAEVDGSRIQESDRKVLASVGDTAPAVGDTVAIDGSSARVEAVLVVSPAGIPVMYEMQVRL